MQARMRTRGTLLRVIDGDTLLVKMECPCCKITSQQRVRLARIDAPELKGPRRGDALQARACLACLLTDTAIEILAVRQWPDRYGRVLAEVWYHGQNVSDWMLLQPNIRHYHLTKIAIAQTMEPGDYIP